MAIIRVPIFHFCLIDSIFPAEEADHVIAGLKEAKIYQGDFS